jgi:hypothetical protein
VRGLHADQLYVACSSCTNPTDSQLLYLHPCLGVGDRERTFRHAGHARSEWKRLADFSEMSGTPYTPSGLRSEGDNFHQEAGNVDTMLLSANPPRTGMTAFANSHLCFVESTHDNALVSVFNDLRLWVRNGQESCLPRQLNRHRNDNPKVASLPETRNALHQLLAQPRVQPTRDSSAMPSVPLATADQTYDNKLQLRKLLGDNQERWQFFHLEYIRRDPLCRLRSNDRVYPCVMEPSVDEARSVWSESADV